MPAAYRDRRNNRSSYRCNPVILLGALILFFLAVPASAIDVSSNNAEFYIAENGSAFTCEIVLLNEKSYKFIKPGLLGEDIPREVSNVSLKYTNGTDAPFEFDGLKRSVSFEEGNYTICYDSEVGSRLFECLEDKPYNITLYLPNGYDVRNPLLGHYTIGADIRTAADDNGSESVEIFWKNRHITQARFYDAFQENCLVIFGTFWLALAAIFLVPYLISRFGRKEF